MANDAQQQHQRWFPLESNPTLINHYLEKLGFHTNLYHFVDVYSTEEWALEMVPQPVQAVLLLYPLTEPQLAHEKEERESITAAAATGVGSSSVGTTNIHIHDPNKKQDEDDEEEDVWFMKQRIGNACGTIGILHCLLNSHEALTMSLQPQSWLADFIAQTTTTTTTTVSSSSTTTMMKAVGRAEILEADPIISSLHDAATSSSENQTNRGNLDDDVMTHFIALVRGRNNNNNKNSYRLYECDGRKEWPIDHGECHTDSELLPKALQVIKTFMARDPQELRFTILALAPNK